MKKRIKRQSILLITIMLSFSICVNASSIYSSWKTTGTINGYAYQYRSGMSKTSNSVVGEANTRVKTSNVMVPDKYMAGRAYVYTVGGILCSASDWEYSSGPASGYYFRGHSITNPGTYYCIGKFKYKKSNGNYTSPYTAKRTATVVLGSKGVSVTETPMTIDGKYETSMTNGGATYGSGLCELTEGKMPDMVSAQGENGIVGYVYSKDLNNHDDDTFVEAKKNDLLPGEISKRFIPLYSLDERVIGKFLIFTEGGDTLEGNS